MYRTRFQKDIVCEFLPPEKSQGRDRVIFLCDGMPSMPSKQPLAEFLSRQGYWVFYPRYRGSWESSGVFLQKSPHLDILDILSALEKNQEIRESAFGESFRLNRPEYFVIGGSFGGTVSLLSSIHPKVKRVLANCPVTDWSILEEEESAETSNPSYVAYIKEAFGNGYNLTESNWKKLKSGKFFNPIYQTKEFDSKKVIMFHAKDDPFIPASSVIEFSQRTGIPLFLLNKGGHLSTSKIVKKYWRRIDHFFRRGPD